MREENERNEKAKVWSMCSQASVFSTIRLKFERGKGYLAHIRVCVRVVKAASPESDRFYELSSRDRCQKSVVVGIGGGGRCNCR